MVLLDLKPKGLCRARFLGEPLDGGPSRGLYRKCVHAVLSVAPTLGVQFWDIMSQKRWPWFAYAQVFACYRMRTRWDYFGGKTNAGKSSVV